MSGGPWAKTAAEKPYGFRVTIERSSHGSREILTFRSKTPARAAAVQAAGYKKGFLRLIEARPLTREEWNREFGLHLASGARSAISRPQVAVTVNPASARSPRQARALFTPADGNHGARASSLRSERTS
jgi:hypothetical protein